MLINYLELSEQALNGIVEQYILTQLSDVEIQIPLIEWREQVLQQVKRQELLVEYSEANDSVYLICADSIVR